MAAVFIHGKYIGTDACVRRFQGKETIGDWQALYVHHGHLVRLSSELTDTSTGAESS